MRKNLYLFLLFFLSVNIAEAQRQSCRVILLLKRDGGPIEITSNHGFVDYNYTTGDLRFSLDLATLRSGDSKLDSIFIAKGSNFMTFQGNISINNVKFTPENTSEKHDYPLEGTLTVNNIPLSINSRYTLLSSGKVYKEARINFFFELNTESFSMDILEGNVIHVIAKEAVVNRM